MPVGYHEAPLAGVHRYYVEHYDPYSGEDSAASILQSVREQEAQFEALTKELEAERQSVANQLERCKLGSETASLSSISSTDESFRWHPRAPTATYTTTTTETGDPLHPEHSETGSQLVDSCLPPRRSPSQRLSRRVLEERGFMNISDHQTFNELQREYDSAYRSFPLKANDYYEPRSATRSPPPPARPELPRHYEDMYGAGTYERNPGVVTQEVYEEGEELPPNTHITTKETVTEEIGPDGSRIIRKQHQEEQVTKVTKVTRIRTVRRTNPDGTFSTYTETIPEGGYAGANYENYSSEHYHDDRSYTHSYPDPVRGYAANGGPPKGRLQSFPEDNQGYPEERNMDYEVDDLRYSDDRYEGLTSDFLTQQSARNSRYSEYDRQQQSRRSPSLAGSERFGHASPRVRLLSDNLRRREQRHLDKRRTSPRGRMNEPLAGSPTLRTRVPLIPVSQPWTSRDRGPPGYTDRLDSSYMLHDASFENGDALRAPLAQIETPGSTLRRGGAKRSPSLDSRTRDMGWRYPDLPEVIEFLSNDNDNIKSNAAAYLQHLCFMDDDVKAKTRALNGVPPLVRLLANEHAEVFKHACGALRNLSYGKANDDNKRAIKNADGIPALVRLLRKTTDPETQELVTAVLWNLSSCEDLKLAILNDGLKVIVDAVIIPFSGWEPRAVAKTKKPEDLLMPNSFRNATGTLRNCSSADSSARNKLRMCEGLVEALIYTVKLVATSQSVEMDNKGVENCVCILRNLSYRCQEVEDPNYDKNIKDFEDTPDQAGPGCMGGKKKPAKTPADMKPPRYSGKGMDLLWTPEVVVPPYVQLLHECSNPETLEAIAGCLQNLSACYWQPAHDIRAAVRKEKGLPILVELLRINDDRVVRVVAIALRNLAIDPRNKDLIGKYGMTDLVKLLPPNDKRADAGDGYAPSDETIAAALSCLNEVVKDNLAFAQSCLNAGGVARMINVIKDAKSYSDKVQRYAAHVLFQMYRFKGLHAEFERRGYNKNDFVNRTLLQSRSASASPANTLHRPRADLGGDSSTTTTRRSQPRDGESIPLSTARAQAPSNREPLYAQVHKDKRRRDVIDGDGVPNGADSWV